MTGSDWLRRWMGSPAPEHGWGDNCPAGIPVPEARSCARLDCDSVALTALTAGERACVTCLEQSAGTAAARLGSLGLLPGIELEVVQRFPAYVLRIGYTEIAIDDNLASIVRVRRV